MSSADNEESRPTNSVLSSAKWTIPPAHGGLTDDGERYRLRWWPASGTTKIALFRVSTDDHIATLQHVRSIVLQQAGETSTQLNPDVELEDIPEALLAVMRDRGLKPASKDRGAMV